jgi:hypothetical protein
MILSANGFEFDEKTLEKYDVRISAETERIKAQSQCN